MEKGRQQKRHINVFQTTEKNISFKGSKNSLARTRALFTVVLDSEKQEHPKVLTRSEISCIITHDFRR